MKRCPVGLFLAGVPFLVSAGRHVGPDSRILAPIGVCKIDEGGAVCWDLMGKMDPSLTRDIDGRARESMLLSIRNGLKNRFAIVRQNMPSSSVSITTNAGVPFANFSKAGEKPLLAFRILADPESKTSLVSARVSVWTGSSVDVPLRDGATGRVNDLNFSLSGLVFSPAPWEGTWFFGSQHWRFGLERSDTSPLVSLSYEGLDRRGQAIRFVDPDGIEFDTKKGEAIWDQIAKQTWDWRIAPGCEYARFQQSGDFFVATNISPKSITKLRVRKSVEHTETLGPLPLDAS